MKNLFSKRVLWLIIPLLTLFTVNAWGDTYTLVTSNSSLNNGDKVVLARNVSSQPGGDGVTGWNNSKDATVSATASDWVQYTVSSASGSGWKLYDSSASKYIADPDGSNQFLYDNSGYTCSVDGDGHLICHTRYLCKNGSNYRFYGSIGSYQPFCVWKVTAGSGGGCDYLDKAFTGNPGSYTSWSSKNGSASDAVYAGNSSGNNNSIQIRGSSNSGIVTTASGGTAISVTVTWNDNTQNGRTLNIYGKNTAYSSATDLYSASSATQGTLLGTIVKGTSTELSISGSYTYIGLRSNADAMYLSNITICWGSGSSCTADPSRANATLNTSFVLTSLTDAVSVSSGTWGAGSNCEWTDYGFVWGTSSSLSVSNNKVQVGTSGNATSWITGAGHQVQPSGSTSPTAWVVGTTYYVKAYGKNGKTGAEYVYSASATSFILRSITFNVNGGSSVGPWYVKSGQAYSAPSPAPTKTGYDFAGWYANEALTTAVNWSSTISANKTYYAKWTAKTTTVSFNQNGGDGGQTTSKTATYGQAMPTPITLPTREGYTFAGYYESSGGTGNQYYTNEGASARTWDKENSTWTLYAKWTPNVYTVTWKVNDTNYSAGGSSSVNHGGRISTLPTAPDPGDYCGDKFVGWTTDAEYVHETSPLFTVAGSAPIASGNQIFYAVFADYAD